MSLTNIYTEENMTKQNISGDERRAAIIEAAIKVIARTSFEDCSTISIAGKAGITEPLIYYHFKTKKDLQLAVLDTVLKGNLSILDVLHELPTLTITEMRVFGKEFQRDIKKNPDRITVVLKALAMEDEEIRTKVWEIFYTVHSALKMLLDKIASKSNVSIEEQTTKEAWNILFWMTI